MSTIRVVWGSATGPTAMASYDAALAEANVHDYNLVTVSSVVPEDTDISVEGTAPDLGPRGNRLTVVQGRSTRAPDEDVPAAAGLGWARSNEGPGIFYEASGDNPETVRRTIEDGLDHGVELRDWEEGERETFVRLAELDDDAYSTVVVLAIYGESEPIC
ncbi:pyruvoyl-dependent arginine decarboxylase [Halobacteriales archaeon Cl-PHB]